MNTQEGPTAPHAHRTRGHIGRNILVVAAAFGLAALAGLGRNIIITQRFALGAGLDAYYAAFKLPDLLFTIIAGGALATAFIPVLAESVTADDRDAAWRLTSAITNLVLLVMTAVAIAAALSAPWLVRTFIAPGFTPVQQAETVSLMRLVLISTVLFGISSVQTSALHTFQHFLLPALAPAVYPLAIAAGAWWLAPTWGVQGLAMGAVAGAALHLAIKIPALLHFGFRWQPRLGLRDPAVRRVAVLMGPRVLDLAVFHLTLLFTTNLASRLDAGSITALEWGWDAMQLPETVLGTAFGLVAFPTLAQLAAAQDLHGLRATFAEALRAVLALTIPAAVGLLMLGRPLLELLYQRGSFDETAIAAIFAALCGYLLGLVAHSGLELTARAFFAQKDTITPLWVAAGAGVIQVLLGLALLRPLGVVGLALANSLAVGLEVLVLLWLLRQRWGSVEGRAMLLTLGRVLLAALAMAGVIALSLQLAAAAGAALLPTVVLAAALGGLTYFVVGGILRERALAYLPTALFPSRYAKPVTPAKKR